MTEQRYRYATVGVTEEKDVPAVLLGKRNATFEIAGMEYERTAILKLPEKMNQTEFDTWKESGGIDLIDMFFHCIHQKSVRPDGPEEPENDHQADLMTDGGEVIEPTEDEIEHRFRCSRKQLLNLQEKLADTHSEAFTTVSRLIAKLDETEEEVKELVLDDAGGSEVMPDGGSSMPKLALQTLKELKEVGDKLGELLSEMTGEELESFSDIYATEQSRPEANNEIELGDGFSLREAEYAELLGILEQARAAAADDPIPLGVRNRLLMNVIIANPEEYARVKADEMERRKEAQEKARQQFNEAVGRQRMNERMADLNDGVDIPIDGDGEGSDG
jgi:hypothetical protein